MEALGLVLVAGASALGGYYSRDVVEWFSGADVEFKIWFRRGPPPSR